MNPTPRPWHYEDHVIRSVSGQNVSGLVPRRMSAGDLQLILTAVNGYDAMREALLRCADELQRRGENHYSSLAYAALALAYTQEVPQ